MKLKSTLIPLLLFLSIQLTAPSLFAQSKATAVGESSYPYSSVDGDPLKARIYTLKNGLKVYMTVNKNEPRVQTCIAVRAGSKNDPADATGLAHYLEHMLFKGTDKYGSLDYKKEKELLDQVEAMFERYRQTTDPEERKSMYKKIDELSGEAAKYAIANEYDKMLSAIGAKGTNAYTSFEQTVYINEIPSNQIDKWLMIESERFRAPVFRLFHTELEAVYEEKNMSLDRDGSAAFEKLFSTLFNKHNYGLQTTIGTVEHLKNPSIVKIRDYYNKNYVPNNMAICLSGDFDPDKTIKQIDKAFGYMQASPVKEYTFEQEAPIEKPIETEVWGPEVDRLMMAFRFPGVNHADSRVLTLIDMLLANSAAGLIDLNLNQKQKVLRAGCFPYQLVDHSVHIFSGTPREGQSLEEVRDMLLEQVELVKAGEFEDELLLAVVNDLEKERMESYERNYSRADAFVESFTSHRNWADYVHEIEELRKITKEQIVKIANQYYKNNYVVVYKRKGDRKDVQKVEKPEITPVEVNREAKSEFLQKVVDMEAANIAPRFLDYSKDIEFSKTSTGTPIHYVKNNENSLFTMYYLLNFGSSQDKKMAFAIEYLPYLGTDKYSAEDIQKKFYSLGCSFNVFTGNDQIYVYLNGLEKNYKEALRLFEHILAKANPDAEALKNLVEGELKSRADAKLNKNVIMYRGLSNYGLYGKRNPFNDVLSEAELRALRPEELTTKIKTLTSYPHKVLYYGPHELSDVESALNSLHHTLENPKPLPEAEPYVFQDSKDSKVYFVEFDMVQAQVLWGSKSVDYDPEMTPIITMYNEYYGGGMSSIVFQTIRESKALAYGTYSTSRTPQKKGEPYFVTAFVGTQADKLHDAMDAMFELLNGMPEVENLFNGGRDAIKNKIDTERIIRTSKLFRYENALRRGIDRDLRKDVYEALPNITLEDVKEFHKKYISGNNYNIMILGSKDKIDLKSLEKYGEVRELTLEEVFGY